MLEDPAARPHSLDELAALYVKAIRLVQPEGPYLLGGWSFGGVVAAEMARQLQKSGDAVAELILFDVSSALHPNFEVLRRRGLADGYHALYDHHLSLLRGHEPAQLDVPATHFVAEESSRVDGSSDGWNAAVTIRVPGDHFSMLAGVNTAPLAARLSEVLDAAERRARTSDEAESESATEHEQAVRAYLENFMDLSCRDGRRLVEQLWRRDDSCVLFDSYEGTFVGWTNVFDQYGHEFDAIRDANLRKYDERVQIFAGGHAACATALLDANLTLTGSGKRVNFRRVRITCVLERNSSGWRALHVHYSLPVGEPLSEMA